ncbi:hypothetical protein NSQ93_22385 [Bacillus sp. FSL W8-0445]|uniref:hypothetical protein n=1 Tax=Bacillota TaxID=1239 RepID=UPI0011BE7C09|nr:MULTISPECIES: hypothetical protein [Bacillota]NFT30607.1 hypothetical protein [Clostridium sporogenes]TWM14760.1 hypothetical protein CHCC15091_1801 [Bacillus licheniformis]GIN25506.1 hypothetical protein J31TS2_20860 [Bacillus licheniformis]GIN29755.1 hypothetical protein J2TS5_17940 [Bacillus licheniformis]
MRSMEEIVAELSDEKLKEAFEEIVEWRKDGVLKAGVIREYKLHRGRRDNMKIKAEELVDDLNKWIESKDSLVRFKFDRRTSLPAIDIIIKDKYIDNYFLNLSNEFYDVLEKYLKNNFGIEKVSFNNVGSCFWHNNIV